jgi:hypothetical protein
MVMVSVASDDATSTNLQRPTTSATTAGESAVSIPQHTERGAALDAVQRAGCAAVAAAEATARAAADTSKMARRYARQVHAAEDAAWTEVTDLVRLGVALTDPVWLAARDKAGRLTAASAMADAARERMKALSRAARAAAELARADASLAFWSAVGDVPAVEFLADAEAEIAALVAGQAV